MWLVVPARLDGDTDYDHDCLSRRKGRNVVKHAFGFATQSHTQNEEIKKWNIQKWKSQKRIHLTVMVGDSCTARNLHSAAAVWIKLTTFTGIENTAQRQLAKNDKAKQTIFAPMRQNQESYQPMPTLAYHPNVRRKTTKRRPPSLSPCVQRTCSVFWRLYQCQLSTPLVKLSKLAP